MNRSILRQATKTVWNFTRQKDISVLLNRLKQHDEYTYHHSLRVAHYCLELAKRKGLPGWEQDILTRSALLHDIGKLRIPKAVLQKKDRLTHEEWELIRMHPRFSLEIAQKFVNDHLIDREVILYHHENLDGTGYPVGLNREDLSLAVRMIRVADSFDAMTTIRKYNQPKSFVQAFAELFEFVDIYYDRDSVQVLQQYIQEISRG